MSSALGVALGMTSTYTWAQVVDAIKGIPCRDVFTDAVSVGFGDNVYIRVPKGAYLNLASTGYPEIRVARSDVSPGTANTAQVLSGYTFSSANGSNLSGSMANYSSYGGTKPTDYGTNISGGYPFYMFITSAGYYSTNRFLWLTIEEVMSKVWSECFKFVSTTLTSSTSTYTFKDDEGNATKTKYYAEFRINEKGSIRYFGASYKDASYTGDGGHNWWRITAGGTVLSGNDTGIPWLSFSRTYGSNWYTNKWQPLPVESPGLRIKVEYWYCITGT